MGVTVLPSHTCHLPPLHAAHCNSTHQQLLQTKHRRTLSVTDAASPCRYSAVNMVQPAGIKWFHNVDIVS